MSERVLVTGGAGFIGSHLVDALLRRGDSVRVLDNLHERAHPTGEARHLSREAELVAGDLRDQATVDRALDGIEVVYHQASILEDGRSMFEVRRYAEVNVVGTAALLEAIVARRAQIRAVVVASSMVVYGDGTYRCAEHGLLARALRPEKRLEARLWEPTCPTCGREVEAVATTEEHPLQPASAYAVTKRTQEELALVVGRAHRIPTVALRYFNTYGSRQAPINPYTGVVALMATRLSADKPPLVFEDGHQRRDFTHVSDVVRANLAAADADERAWWKPFNVGTGRSVDVLTVARALAEVLGKSIEPNVTGEHRDGDIRHCFADVTRARELLGWEARVSFEEGVAERSAADA